jgi:hypothetical protein
MFLHANPTVVDTKLYARALNAPSVLYGLPQQVYYCSRWVISNQRPNSTVEFKHTAASKKTTIQFDSDDVCDACKFAESKASSIVT